MARRYHLHIPGLLFIAVTLIVGFAAINSQRNLLFWIFGVMTAALVLSGVISGWMMMRLTTRRLDPDHGTVDDALVVQYSIENQSRFIPAFNVSVEDRPTDRERGWRIARPGHAWIMHVGPGETMHGEAVFWPTGRGRINFDQIRIWTTFPFGILKKSVTISQPQHTLVYPKLYQLRRHVLRAMVPDGPPGAKVATHPGANDDYFGLREYRQGDSLRHIAWKRLASRDELVSIERTRPNPPRIRVVVDLTEPTEDLRVDADRETVSPRDLEEHAISLAASIIHAADDEGFEVGLIVPGVDMPRVPIRRNPWHRGKLMAALAGIDLDAPRQPLVEAQMPGDERAAMVVIHPDRVNMSVGASEALRLKARQLASLIEGPLGWTARARSEAHAKASPRPAIPAERSA